MLALLLLISFAVGLTIGLQIHHIISGLRAAIGAVHKAERKVNTGVVRPGLNARPNLEAETASKSAVVRPKVPVPDPDETNQALESVRNRTANV